MWYKTSDLPPWMTQKRQIITFRRIPCRRILRILWGFPSRMWNWRHNCSGSGSSAAVFVVAALWSISVTTYGQWNFSRVIILLHVHYPLIGTAPFAVVVPLVAVPFAADIAVWNRFRAEGVSITRVLFFLHLVWWKINPWSHLGSYTPYLVTPLWHDGLLTSSHGLHR